MVRSGVSMKNIQLIILSIALCILGSTSSIAQDSLQVKIRVKGKAVNKEGLRISDLLIINDASYTGVFGNADGTFDVTAKKQDTLIFGAVGYRSYKVCYRDSAFKEVYNLDVQLLPIKIEVGEAQVFAPRDLEDIQKDIDQLGFDEKDYRVSGVSAVESPITFLYQQFSKREKSKRLVAEMENDDRRRELLKELFEKYVDYEIINLSDDEFDEFIDYINVSDSFLQTCTQYEFIIFVKDRYADYESMKRRRGLQDNDYYYDED